MSVLISLLVVSAFAGTVIYYNTALNNRNSKIASLNSEIANQNNEIANLTSQNSNLNGQITNLTTANLTASLDVYDRQVATVGVDLTTITGYLPLYSLDINGSVTNTEDGTAYNAGLHVIAYDANDTVEVNITVPINSGGFYGIDAGTDAWVSRSIGLSPLQLGSLDGETTQTITIIQIFHGTLVHNWTVTPVWTNTP